MELRQELQKKDALINDFKQKEKVQEVLAIENENKKLGKEILTLQSNIELLKNNLFEYIKFII